MDNHPSRIPQILRDVPVKAVEHRGAGVLLGTHHLAQIFWVQLAGERHRAHEVTKQDGELAPFRFKHTCICRSGGMAVGRSPWR